MDLQRFNHELFEFLKFSTSPFHAVQYLSTLFLKSGFTKLEEKDRWQTTPGKGYFCVRDDGSLLVFKLSGTKQENDCWRMLAAHTDSPSLQIKPQPVTTSNTFTQLGVEVYGGPILSTWFDRDLSIAGRVSLLDQENNIHSRTIDFKQPLAIIPNLAIHLNREVNDKYSIKRQKHLLPLLCQTEDDDYSFHDTLLQQVQEEHDDLKGIKLLGFDLFCYDTQAPSITGLHGDFISASRLDNLVSCFIGTKSMLEETSGNCLLLCSNHEEIGSSTVAGAQGNFLTTVLERLEADASKRMRMLSNSSLISMDNAHGLHPNFPEKHDPQHLPLLNKGPVIKYNANQRYASTSKSAALFKVLCDASGTPVQEFVMHNDLRCGSTIGPIAATSLGIQTVDVGIPSLAMHSIRETTGVKDPYMLFKAISRFLTCTNLPGAGA